MFLFLSDEIKLIFHYNVTSFFGLSLRKTFAIKRVGGWSAVTVFHLISLYYTHNLMVIHTLTIVLLLLSYQLNSVLNKIWTAFMGHWWIRQIKIILFYLKMIGHAWHSLFVFLFFFFFFLKPEFEFFFLS